MFDTAEIIVKAGDGGNGKASFRREKFVPFGGPDGGDGGKGGDVIVRADAGVTNLKIFRWRGMYRAKDGLNGEGQKKSVRMGLIRSCWFRWGLSSFLKRKRIVTRFLPT